MDNTIGVGFCYQCKRKWAVDKGLSGRRCPQCGAPAAKIKPYKNGVEAALELFKPIENPLDTQ